MIRTSPSVKVFLLAERPHSEAKSSGAPLRRFRIARLGLPSGPPAEPQQLPELPATEG